MIAYPSDLSVGFVAQVLLHSLQKLIKGERLPLRELPKKRKARQRVPPIETEEIDDFNACDLTGLLLLLIQDLQQGDL
jgi:hypothetical protein